MSSKAGPVRVLIAEDHPVYRHALTSAVNQRPDLEFVAECDNGEQALAEIRQLLPTVALLDMVLPKLEGIEIVRSVVKDDLDTRLLLISGYVESEMAYAGIAAGAAGFLSKDMDVNEICDAIVATAEGKTVLAEGVQSGIASEMRRRRSDPGVGLTHREEEVLIQAAEGRSAEQIGERLNLSAGTVKTYLHQLYTKFEVSGRAALVAKALRKGIIS